MNPTNSQHEPLYQVSNTLHQEKVNYYFMLVYRRRPDDHIVIEISDGQGFLAISNLGNITDFEAGRVYEFERQRYK